MCAALPYVVEVRRKDELDEWQPRAAFDLLYRAEAYASSWLELNASATYPWKYRVSDLMDASRER
jgi:hypothetical protein